MKKNNALLCCFKVKLSVLLAVELVIADIGERSDLLKFAEKETDCVKSFCRACEILFCNKILLVSIYKMLIKLTAVEVAGVLE